MAIRRGSRPALPFDESAEQFPHRVSPPPVSSDPGGCTGPTGPSDALILYKQEKNRYIYM